MGAISSPEVIWGMLIAAATNSIAQRGSVINKANLLTRFYHQRYHSPSTVPHQPSTVPLFNYKNHQRYHISHQRYQKTINGTKNHHHRYHIKSRMTRNQKRVSRSYTWRRVRHPAAHYLRVTFAWTEAGGRSRITKDRREFTKRGERINPES